MGFISLIYPNIRAAERPLPTAPPAPVVTPLPEAGAEAPAVTELQTLEQRRQSIVTEARALASTGNTVAQFQRLLRRATLFLNDVTRALPPRPFPATPEALELLENCIRLLEMEREISPRRVTAITNCQASSRLLGEALSTPVTSAAMAPPGLVPVAELPDFELPSSPTRRNAEILARHLRLLQRLGVQRGDVQGRMAEIAEDLEGWVDQLNDAITQEQATAQPRQARLDALRRVLEEIEEVGSSLGVGEIAEAIEALARAYPPTG